MLKLNPSLLHVDDDPAMTRIVAQLLKNCGIEVTSLNDPTVALNRLLHDHHRIVLLDIDMPGVNGLELLKQIKQFDGGISVIMLTGIVSMSTVLQSMRRGAAACFFKPLVDVEPLIEVIRSERVSIDRWWSTLHTLSELRHRDAVAY